MTVPNTEPADMPLPETDAERQLNALRKGDDPAFMKALSDPTLALTPTGKATQDAAVERYRKLQDEERAAQKQRAEARRSRYSDEEIADAEQKIRVIRMGLTEEARNFNSLLTNAAHIEHKRASEDWRRWNMIVNSKKKA